MTQPEFNQKVLPLRDKVYRYALTILGNPMDAEDMVQDALGKLWQMRDRLDGMSNLDAFVFRMVRNQSLDLLRADSLHREKMEEVFMDYSEESPVGQEEIKDLHALVRRLMAQLPEKPRTVIHLRDVEGYEMDEIADIVGDDVATVRVILSRARKTIREKTVKLMNYGIQIR